MQSESHAVFFEFQVLPHAYIQLLFSQPTSARI